MTPDQLNEYIEKRENQWAESMSKGKAIEEATIATYKRVKDSPYKIYLSHLCESSSKIDVLSKHLNTFPGPNQKHITTSMAPANALIIYGLIFPRLQKYNF